MPPKFIKERIQSYCRQFAMALGNYYALLPSGELVCDSTIIFKIEIQKESLSFVASKQYEKFRDDSASVTYQPGVDIVGKVWKEEKYHWESNAADLSKSEFQRQEIALKEGKLIKFLQICLGIHASITIPVYEAKKKCGVVEFFFWETKKEDPLLVKTLVLAFSRT